MTNVIEIELGELDQARIGEMVAQLEAANTNINAEYRIWRQSPTVVNGIEVRRQARTKLRSSLLEIMHKLNLDPNAYTFDMQNKKFVPVPVKDKDLHVG